MRLTETIFTVRNYLWRLQLRLIVRWLKLLHFRFNISKTGLLTLVGVILFAGTALGYTWCFMALNTTHREEVAYWMERDAQWQDRHVRIRAELFDLVAQKKITRR
jgi:hypothetical protein